MLDHSDSLAYSQDKSFAILLHGVQKTGTEAALAMSQLRRAGKNGYNKKKIKVLKRNLVDLQWQSQSQILIRSYLNILKKTER
jgi:hypothetical protein